MKLQDEYDKLKARMQYYVSEYGMFIMVSDRGGLLE